MSGQSGVVEGHGTAAAQFSSNGDWLLYLAPNGSSIQLVGYERHTQERRTLTTGEAPVRQFVIP